MGRHDFARRRFAAGRHSSIRTLLGRGPRGWIAAGTAFVMVVALATVGASAGNGIAQADAGAGTTGPTGITTSIALQDTGGKYGDSDPKDFILAGEDATFDVSVKNGGSTAGYNTSVTLLLPADVAFVSSPMGTPVIYAAGDELPNSATTGAGGTLNTVPAGKQLWVFQDVSDLPAHGTYPSTLIVRPKATTFPAGTTLDVTMTGYVSSDPALIPMFDGSTGVGAQPAANATGWGDAPASVVVKALRLTKSEPSPEIELLRGVHDHPTVYTLTVEATGEGTTSGITVVDYLPAGLEFLGCGAVDNTTTAAQLYDDGSGNKTREYPGAGDLTVTTSHDSPATWNKTRWGAPDCLTPESVETVQNDSAAPSNAVYTKVTWTLNSTDQTGWKAGTKQTYSSTAGKPATYQFQYLAAVPLFKNTMTFGSTAPDSTCTDVSGTWTCPQAANLANNNGASTRQGLGDGFGDGQEYTNSATVSGTYAGDSTSDTDTEKIDAMDLRILKSVSTGKTDPDNADHELFDTGKLATYTLTLDTGEYASADGIVITDTLPNGLCPALPSPALGSIDTNSWPSDCRSLDGSLSPALNGATVTAITYNASDGTFTMTLAPVTTSMTANAEDTITYTAPMRANYQKDTPFGDNTSSGDAFTNHVSFDAWTHAIPALNGVTNGSGEVADDSVKTTGEDVWDDSAATIYSSYTTIDKKVLRRGSVQPGSDAASACNVSATDSRWVSTATDPFRLGDYVCYQLSVDFPDDIAVRNPKITDFVPQGVEYVGWAVASETSGVTAAPADATVTGNRIDWRVGAAGTDNTSARLVPVGAKLVLHVLGEVTSLTPNGNVALDKPENLMKYQQENTPGDLYFLRDAAAITVDKGVSLIKGVQSVTDNASSTSSTRPAKTEANADGAVFGSNRDGIAVADGEKVTYRVDVTGAPFDTKNVVVWDALPKDITKSAVPTISDSGTAYDPDDSGYPSSLPSGYSDRSVIVWNLATLAADAQKSLTYTVTIPSEALVHAEYKNTASVISYEAALNGSGSRTETYYPTDSLDATERNPDTVPGIIPGDGTRDDSDVYVPDPTVAKTLKYTEVGASADGGVDLGDANNGTGVAVQGELVTWEYSVTIPAYTTVKDGVLSDTLPAGFTVTDGKSAWTDPGNTTHTADGTYGGKSFTFDTGTGKLTFPTGTYSTTTADQAFTVTLTGYFGDFGNNGATATNKATFTSTSFTKSASADVTYREPNPTIEKSADPMTDLVGGDTVTYTLKATNPGSNRPTSWDTVVTDCVPAALLSPTLTSDDGGKASFSGTCTDDSGSTSGYKLTWDVGALAQGVGKTITYTAKLPATPAGSSDYKNTATITGYTLPKDAVNGATLNDDPAGRRGTRTGDSSVTLELEGATLTKSVDMDPATAGDQTAAPIGSTATYTVTVTLPENLQFFDAVVHDTLPDGVLVASVSTPTVTCTSFAGTCPTATQMTASGQTIGWSLGDIADASTERTLTLTYSAEVVAVDVTTPKRGDSLSNTAIFGWNTVDGSDPAGPGTTPPAQSNEGTASFTVTEPNLSIQKRVKNDDGGSFAASASGKPGDTFTYQVKVTNDSGANVSAAHHVTVTDTAPAGVKVDTSSFEVGSAAVASPTTVALTGADATTDGGGTITWTDLGPIEPGASVTLTYTGTFVDSAHLTDDDEVNTAAVTDYYSVDGETHAKHYEPGTGSEPAITDTATVTPKFPRVTVAKAATSGSEAYIGAPFTWTITATNAAGAGAAKTVTLTDTLPANWTYTGTTSVTIAGVAQPGPTAPTVTGAGNAIDPQKLVWTLGTDAGELGAAGLTAGKTVVIVYTATPGAAVVDSPGINHYDTDGTTKLTPAHTNTVGVTAADLTDATRHSDGSGGTTPYGGPDATADTHIRAADVTIDKAIEETPAAGLTGKWKLTVRNLGPDTAEPVAAGFTVTDSTPPPTGFELTAAAGAGWTCDAIDTTHQTVHCVRATPTDTLVKDASFPDIIVTYSVAAGVIDGTTYENEATVSGSKTYDPNDPTHGTDNNIKGNTATVGATADLGVTKTLDPDHMVAGETASYSIVVHNYGPADSQGPTTVADPVPDGTTFVSAIGTGWVCTNPPAGASTGTISCVYGTLADGADSDPLTIKVKVDSGRIADVVNTATVTATTNEGANTNSNIDHVTKTPDQSADIAVVKSVGTTPVRGGSGSWVLTVTNNGPSDASSVHLSDDLSKQADGVTPVPAGFDSLTVAFDAAVWSACTIDATPKLDCDYIGTMKAGATTTVTVTYDVASSVVAGTVWGNKATVDSTTPDPNDLTHGTNNNEDTASATVLNPPPPPGPVDTSTPETTTSPAPTSPTTPAATTSTTAPATTPTVPTVHPSSATSPAGPVPPTNAPATTIPADPDQCTGMTETGFEPGESVTITVTGEHGQYQLSGTADETGTVRFCFDASTPGTYTIQVLGEHHEVVRQIVVKGESVSLPNTGVAVARYLTLALLLLGAGIALVLGARRRRGNHLAG